jgi:hypothetical protein
MERAARSLTTAKSTTDDLDLAQEAAKEAATLATQALTFDKEATVPGTEPAVTADDVVFKAGRLQGGATAPLAYVAAWEETWKGFAQDTLKPIGTLLLAGLAWCTGVLVLARALTLSPALTLRTSRRSRAAFSVLGAAGLVVLLLQSANWLASDRVLSLVALAAVSLVTAIAWAIVLASRLRLTITARSKDTASEGLVTEIVAKLRALGGDTPTGVEVPRGTDVSLLDGKTISEGASGVLGAAVRLLQSLLGVTPWTVIVDTDPSGRTSAVINRNGRQVAAEDLAAEPDDVLPAVLPSTLAASFILMTLATTYPKDFEGLAGASRWRSIGWQYSAEHESKTSDGLRLELLTKAVDLDPGNRPAQVALWHERYRGSQDLHELGLYARWLLDQASALAAQRPAPSSAWSINTQSVSRSLQPLAARILFTATVVSLNGAALEKQRLRDPQTWSEDAEEALNAAVALGRRTARHLALLLGTMDNYAFRAEMRPHASVVVRFALGDKPEHAGVAFLTELDSASGDGEESQDAHLVEAARGWIPAQDRRGLRYLFNEACFLAMRGAPDQAVENMRQVVATREWRQRIHDDPMLESITAHADYQRLLTGEPRDDLLTIAPFSGYAETFRAANLGATAPVCWPSAWELKAFLGVESFVARRLHDVVTMVTMLSTQLQAAELDPYTMEVTEVLWKRGVHNCGLLAALDPDERMEVAKSVASRALVEGFPPPLPPDLANALAAP